MKATIVWRAVKRCPVCGGRPDGCKYEPDEEQIPLGYPAEFELCRSCMTPLLVPINATARALWRKGVAPKPPLTTTSA